MLALDATTRSEYDAEVTAADAAQAVVDALADPVTVRIYDGAGTVKASGTLGTPWATQAAGVITIGEVSSFAITAAGAPDPSWYLRFESGARWLHGSFGLRGEAADFVLSSDAWINGYTIRLGTVVVNAPSGTAPTLVGAPTSLSFVEGTGGTYNFASDAGDADGDALTFDLIGTEYTGISISPAGLLTVSTIAAAAARDLVVQVMDSTGLTAEHAFTLTITPVVSITPDFIIPSNVSTWDAAISQPQVSGGSVIPNSVANAIIELSAGTSTTVAAAGTRGKLKITNLAGSLGNRMLIRNPAAGAVTIRKPSPSATADVMLTFENCHHFTLDGYLAGSTRDCGIKLTYATGSTTGSRDTTGPFIRTVASSSDIATLTSDFTIQYVEIDGGWNLSAPLAQTGAGIFTNYNPVTRTLNPGDYQENMQFLHCYIHHVSSEGMYIGPNYDNGHVPLRNIEIAHNYVHDCGWSGINGKAWWSGTNSVHDNTVLDCGFNLTTVSGQYAGIAMLSCAVSLYNNMVQDCGEQGIKTYAYLGPPRDSAVTGYGTFATMDVTAYNNVCTGNGGATGSVQLGDGISIGADTIAARPNPRVYSNTCAENEGYGIDINNNAAVGWLRNNVLIGNTAGAYWLGTGGTTQANNTTSGTLAVDYRLTSEDAAVGTLGTDIAATDIEGTSRSGTASKGAYEYA